MDTTELKPSDLVNKLPKGSWCYDKDGVKHLCSLDERMPGYVAVSSMKKKMNATGLLVDTPDKMQLWPEDMFNQTFEVK